MANERYALMCPICKDACYLGKTMGQGIYTNNCDAGERMEIVWDWMWRHLLKCHKEYQWGVGDQTLFIVVHEGHPDLNTRTYNRHKRIDWSKASKWKLF